jgi:hypothetical protein
MASRIPRSVVNAAGGILGLGVIGAISVVIVVLAMGRSVSGSASVGVTSPADLRGCVNQALPEGEAAIRGDRIANNAGIGAVQYRNGQQRIQIVVEGTEADAYADAYEYERSDHAEVKRIENAVIAATLTMSDKEQSAIEGCLND